MNQTCDDNEDHRTSVAMMIKERAMDLLKKQYDPLSMNKKSLDKIKNNEILNFNNLFL